MISPDLSGAPDGLLEVLRREICASGPVPVARYMDMCLTDPQHGYYCRRDAIGATGDFITAPEISQIFGELLGIWVAATWQQLGEPEHLHLIELGPGRGTMMRDVLRAMRVLPGLRERVKPGLVEISPHLRATQRATLAGDDQGLTWADSLQDILDDPTDAVPTIILANEFFDALPVTQFVRVGGQWHERAVGLDAENGLAWTHLSPVAELPDLPEAIDSRANDGDIFETRRPALIASAPTLLEPLAAVASRVPTVLLAIDYGHEGPAIGDTLQAMRAQTYADVLQAPGEQDITSHVDFAELAGILEAIDLETDGPITQSEFLSGLGFASRLERLLIGKDASQANAIETAAHRLVAEPGMGNHFRVLGARSRGLDPLIPFPAPVPADS